MRSVTERQLQDAVVMCAEWLGWLCFHPYHMQRSEPGFPDLVMVRDRIIWAELKTAKNKLSRHQERWRDALQEAKAEWYLWRPDDWLSGRIEEVLR